MPLRHGLFRQQTGPLLVRLGIAGIYSRVQMQVFESPLYGKDAAAYAERAELAVHQRIHTQEVANRLIESLHFLQHHIYLSKFVAILASRTLYFARVFCRIT